MCRGDVILHIQTQVEYDLKSHGDAPVISDGQERPAGQTDARRHHPVHTAAGHHGGTAGGVRRHRQEELRQVSQVRERDAVVD